MLNRLLCFFGRHDYILTGKSFEHFRAGARVHWLETVCSFCEKKNHVMKYAVHKGGNDR